MRHLIATAAAILTILSTASAGTIKPRDGWSVIDTPQSFTSLVERLEVAVKNEKMGLVNSASASEGAKTLGVTIPGNRVVGVFRNDFAQRMLKASITAGIEAPIRFYITENPDGTATLSYRKPTAVLAPYFEEAGAALKSLAIELDGIFAKIAEGATTKN
ncbi:MAG TPA: DUF302 domain-containing protein [Xanthobacteraceae bacterium]